MKGGTRGYRRLPGYNLSLPHHYVLPGSIFLFIWFSIVERHKTLRPKPRSCHYLALYPENLAIYLRWNPQPVIVTTGDNKDCIRVLLYSYNSTITVWGVLLTYTPLQGGCHKHDPFLSPPYNTAPTSYDPQIWGPVSLSCSHVSP